MVLILSQSRNALIRPHRLTTLLRRSLQTSTSTPPPLYPSSPLYTYSLGLSYAGKESPPFVEGNKKVEPYGFMSEANTEIGKWVAGMVALRAGRGDFQQEVDEARKKWGAGEDFFSIEDARGDLHIALADGVGGWGETCDASLFPQSLCFHYAKAARELANSTVGGVDPRAILEKAFGDVQKDEGVPAGASTLVSARLDEEGLGVFSNLGDSGYAILREGELVYFSEPQTHYFNCPRQLSKIPPQMAHQAIIRDRPASAEVQSFNVTAGDMIVLFTDGFSDNVPASHIPQLLLAVERMLADPANAELTSAEKTSERARVFAELLVGYGRQAMTRTGKEDGGKGWKTPFEIEATKNVPKWGWIGGKIDDITVMTVAVSEKD
ncbi:hypothetical protein IAT38_001690 [Cryptococcus sp. DSM 104549]